MKKFLILLLCLIMVATFVACGAQKTNNVQNDDNENIEKQEDIIKENNDNENDEVKDEGDIGESPKGGIVVDYFDIMKAKSYYIRYRMNMGGEQSEITMAVNGEILLWNRETGEEKTNIIIKDGKTYMINHAESSVLVIESGENETTIEEPIIIDDELLGTEGTGDFLGRRLKYKEYNFDGEKIKYYFDDKAVVGMEAIDDSGAYYIEILELTENIPTNMFEIPSNYTQISM